MDIIEGLHEFHETWAYLAIVANGVAGLVALVAYLARRRRGRPLLPARVVWGVTIAAEAAILVQVLTGVILVSSDRFVVARFHMFYGFVAFITVGLAYSYRDQMRGRVDLLYGLVGLFLMGVGIRAVLQVV